MLKEPKWISWPSSHFGKSHNNQFFVCSMSQRKAVKSTIPLKKEKKKKKTLLNKSIDRRLEGG